ncbi:MAG: DUF2637 domain-containing protein [Actinophytocola sp.]|uniref:DUF2637 domain-containing protein n=1 Tax=Actinophytocola sp. TaxID=1872138 RepID=UPI003D6A1668
MTATGEVVRSRGRAGLDEWVRRGCTLLVAGVAAYASFQHQREFALGGGSDPVGAVLWPLSVDGLLVLATVGVLRVGEQASGRGRVAVWLSFWLGIVMSLAANIAAAPALEWRPVLVAGWPPVALLLAVELLAHGPRSQGRTETDATAGESELTTAETVRGSEGVALVDSESGDGGGREIGQVITLANGAPTSEETAEPVTAQEVMWTHYRREVAGGRMPTGAELDRVAGTNNYGRTVLRQWREHGRIPAADHPGGQRVVT